MDEKQLVAGCIAGDDRAWREFLGTYGGYIYGAVAGLLKRAAIQEQEVAEDVFAAVIEKLLVDDCRALRGFKWNCKLSTWLTSVARNKTYDHLRRRQRHPTTSLSAPIDDGERGLEEVIADRRDLDRDLEVRLSLEEALEMLPTRDSLILRMSYVEGMKEREIGELLGLSADAVSARKSRALKKLKALIREAKPET